MSQAVQDIGADESDRAKAARILAEKHYAVESGLTRVYRVTSADEAAGNGAEPIKLLEVNENTVSSGVMPLHFGPAPASGIFYSSVIIEVTPEELQKIEAQELKLPAGWDHWEELPRPSRLGAV